MAITGKLIADFSSFHTAVEQATAKLTSFKTGAADVEKSLSRMADSLSGKKLIQDATLMAQAIEQLGGTSKLTATELQRVGGQAAEAVAKMQALGVKDIPRNLVAVADAAREASQATATWSDKITGLGTSMVAQVASGQLLADAIKSVGRVLLDVGAALPELALRGAGIADVSDNFEHLSETTGRLSSTLMGALKEGTHNTISDFDLMQVASRDLAAGMNLTDAQFGTLSKGAFALAQATGTDVKTALDTMNDAMLTGRTRALGMLTGKIDLKAAEDKYAASIGTTADRLTDEARLEAARIGIVDAVGRSIDRLGDQTDGLDERVAQAQTAWTNFSNKLGETIARSPVLMAAFDGIKQSIETSFSGQQTTAIEAITKAIDGAAIAAIGFAKAGVSSAGFVIKEWYALQKVIGDTVQIVSGVALAFEYLSLAMAKTLKLASFGPALKARTDDIARINENIDSLLISMKARGEALQEADRRQHQVESSTTALNAALDEIKAKMQGARDSTVAFVGPLEALAKANGSAGTSAKDLARLVKENAEDIKRARKEADEYAGVVLNISVAQRGYNAVLEDYGPFAANVIRWELAHGAAVEDVAKKYKIAPVYVKAVQEQIKFLASVTDTASFAQLGMARILPDLSGRTEQFRFALEGLTSEGLLPTVEAFDDLARVELIEKRTAEDVQRSHGALANQLTSTIGLMPDLGKVASDHIHYATIATVDWSSALDVLGKHLTDIGGIDIRPLIGQFEQLLRVKQGIEPSTAYTAPTSNQSALSGGIIGTVSGAEAVAGGQSAGGAFGMVAGAAGTAVAGSIAAAAASTAGLTSAALSSAAILGATTLGIGAAAVGVALLAKHWLTVSKAEKEARAAFVDLQKAYGSLDSMINAVGDAYAQVGKSRADAQRDLQAALDATHVSAEAERRALEPINAVLAQAKQRAFEVATAVKSLGPAFAAVVAGSDRSKTSLADLGDQAVITFAAQVAGGQSVAETLTTMGPALASIQAGYADLGLKVEDVALQHLLMQSTIATANPTLMAAIGGLSTEMEALEKLGVMNVDTFGAMERSGFQMYTKLQAEAAKAGGSTKDALIPMQKYLHDAAVEAENLGVPLDANTQMLIDQSKDLHIWKDTGQDATAALTDSMGDLVAKVSELIDRLAGPGGVVEAIAGIPRTVDFTVQGHYVPPDVPAQGYERGGRVQAFATGGPVLPSAGFGQPSGTDSVRAWLTPGERVLTVRDTKTFDTAGGVEALRAGRLIDFAAFVDEQKATRAELQRLRQDMSTTWATNVARAMRDQVAQAGRRR